MAFLVVTVGRNCAPFAARCLDSLAAQQDQDFRVHVIDDASDDGTAEVVREWAQLNAPEHFAFQFNAESVGAMRNQRDAWLAMEPADGDVVVWVDLDDRLAHEHALSVVAEHYRTGALVTYGNYTSDPYSDTCPRVRPYPAAVFPHLRAAIRERQVGLWFNHLRTVSWSVLGLLTDADLQDDDGNWWSTGPDGAVMIPALELAGPERTTVIDQTLLVYTSDNPLSEWRRWPEQVNRDHAQMLARPSKVRLP